MIFTTKDYFIAVFYENKKIIGFISRSERTCFATGKSALIPDKIVVNMY